jgi:hypothetical protein
MLSVSTTLLSFPFFLHQHDAFLSINEVVVPNFECSGGRNPSVGDDGIEPVERK